MLLSSTPSLSSENIHFQQILNIHSPMKRNRSLLECTRDNYTQVSELGPSWPSCFIIFLSSQVLIGKSSIFDGIFLKHTYKKARDKSADDR